MPKRPAHVYRTVKVKTDTYTRVARLVASLGTHGWRSVNATREGPATISAVFDEAVILLEARFLERGGKHKS
jgi:hypothetical protein